MTSEQLELIRYRFLNDAPSKCNLLTGVSQNESKIEFTLRCTQFLDLILEELNITPSKEEMRELLSSLQDDITKVFRDRFYH